MNDIRTEFQPQDPIQPPPQAEKLRAHQIIIDLNYGALPRVTVGVENIRIDETGKLLDEAPLPPWLADGVLAIDPAKYADVVAAVARVVKDEIMAERGRYFTKETIRISERLTLVKDEVSKAQVSLDEEQAFLKELQKQLAAAETEEESAHLNDRIAHIEGQVADYEESLETQNNLQEQIQAELDALQEAEANDPFKEI